MIIESIIYSDDIVSVSLIAVDDESKKSKLFLIAIKYLEPKTYYKNGEPIKILNKMGGETDWFILPYTYSVYIAKGLIEQKSAGHEGFDNEGFQKMIEWLIEYEEIKNCIEY